MECLREEKSEDLSQSCSENEVENKDEDSKTNESCEEINLFEKLQIHNPESLPLWDNIVEAENELVFFDANVGEGKRILAEPETTIPELFAIMRQFVPAVSSSMDVIVEELLNNRGMDVNDFDGTTGFTMLHYAVRSEANTLNAKATKNLITNLLDKGADSSIRSLYSDMNSIHFAAYYNSHESLQRILSSVSHLNEDEFCIDSLSDSCKYGTPLHIAASSLSYECVKLLLQHGANPNAINDCGEKPVDCVPKHNRGRDSEAAHKIKRLLFNSMRNYPNNSKLELESPKEAPKHKLQKASDEEKIEKLKVGKSVSVLGNKYGKLKFIGKVEFASGIWCGVELFQPIGKNDGSINGVRYFKCAGDKGVFAPLNRVKLLENQVNQKPTGSKKVHLKLGMTVHLTSHSEHGVIRFIGRTKFSDGVWIGLELSKADGKNDGVVQGQRYFTCKPEHGILVRPDRITLRGVSGSNILPTELT